MNRGKQMAARYVGKLLLMVFAAIFGQDAVDEQTTTTAMELGLMAVTFGGAVLMFFLDKMWHVKDTGTPYLPKKTASLVLLLPVLFIVGCQSVGQGGNTPNVDGAIEGDTAYMGPDTYELNSRRGAQQLILDTDGINKQATGQFHDLAVIVPLVRVDGAPITVLRSTSYPDGTIVEEQVPLYARAFSSDPTDSTIKDLRAGFDEHGFEVTIAEISRVNNVSAWDSQVVESLVARGLITEAQASVALKQAEETGDLLEALAGMGIQLLVP